MDEDSGVAWLSGLLAEPFQNTRIDDAPFFEHNTAPARLPAFRKLSADYIVWSLREHFLWDRATYISTNVPVREFFMPILPVKDP